MKKVENHCSIPLNKDPSLWAKFATCFGPEVKYQTQP